MKPYSGVKVRKVKPGELERAKAAAEKIKARPSNFINDEYRQYMSGSNQFNQNNLPDLRGRIKASG